MPAAMNDNKAATGQEPVSEKREASLEELSSPPRASGKSEVGGSASTKSSSSSSSPQRSIQGLRWLLVCVGVFSSNFLYGLDNTIVADIQAAIIGSFAGSVDKLGWLGVGFPLGSIAITLPIGKSYAMFDIKWLYIGSLLMFAAGSALCGAAPSMDALIVGRVWAGAGGAGMYLGNLNLLQRLTTSQERSIYMSMVILSYGSGAILGPVIGGSLADISSSGWRWAFYLNLFIFAAMLPIYTFLLPRVQQRLDDRTMAKLRSIDWVGVVLSCGFFVTFAMVFTFGGTIWSWGDGQMIALYVVCIATLAAFAAQQALTLFTSKDNRLFPIEFLGDLTMVLMFVCTGCLAGALFVTVYYLPLFFQFVSGDDGVEAAVRLLPFICLYIFGVIMNGVFMVRWGHYMPWFLFSGAFTLVGGALLYTSSASSSSASLYGYSAFCGLGLTAYQAAYSVVPLRAGPHRTAEAVLFINAGQQSSTMVALVVGNAIYQNVAYSGLLPVLTAAGYSASDVTAAVAGARSQVLQSAQGQVRSDALEALVKAIDDAYVLIIVAGAIVVICSVFMKREKVTKQSAAAGGGGGG